MDFYDGSEPLIHGGFVVYLRASVFLKNDHFAQFLSIFNSITPNVRASPFSNPHLESLGFPAFLSAGATFGIFGEESFAIPDQKSLASPRNPSLAKVSSGNFASKILHV
jgi:hypothetical protein